MADAPLSKSAKQRLAKKARDERAAAEAAATAAAAAPPAPAPAPAKAKAAPTNGYPAGKAAPAPAPAAASAKKAAAPAASTDGWTEAAKSKNKKGGGAAKQSPAAAPAPAPADVDPFVQYDDGTGGEWETCTSTANKKKERQTEKQREAEAKKAAEEREEAQAAKDAAYRAKKAEKKAAKNGTAVAAEPVTSASEPASPATNGGSKPVRPDVQASIAAVAAQAKAAAAAAAAGQAAKAPAKKPVEAEEAKPEEPDNTITVTIKVPEEKIGIVIGPKGAKVRQIEEKTGVVNIATSGTTFTIRGEPDKVPLAEKAIKDLISKGYMELGYENFTEASVMVHSSRIPDLVGKRGDTIRTIKEKFNVEIDIPKTPAGAPPKGRGHKVKVDIAGSATGVAACKECISSIMMFYHHEATHPCASHAELDVPSWGHALIIGKGGSEMRHIENNFCVKVYIPRDGESDNKNVVIVGGSDDVAKAKAYIEKKIAASEAEWNDPKKKQPKGEEEW